MDSAIYSGGAEGFTNLDKLALLLWQDDQELVSTWDSCSSYFIEKPAEPGENPPHSGYQQPSARPKSCAHK